MKLNRTELWQLASVLPLAAEGRAPDAAEWQALLSAGYTTMEQYTSAPGGAPAAPAKAGGSTETTFF